MNYAYTLKKIENNIGKNLSFTKFEWVEKQAKKNRIAMLNYQDKFSEELFEKFRILIRACQEIYPNNWDIDFELRHDTSNNRVYILIKSIVIYFDSIEINNKAGYKHTIKDLFLFLPISMVSNNIKIIGVRGMRTTFSLDEISLGYIHSHLRTTRYGGPNIDNFKENFCLGSGEINFFLSELNDNITQERAEKFFLQLYTLISYESIEGVPHVFMSHIKNRFFSTSRESGRYYIPQYELIYDVITDGLRTYKNKKIPIDLNYIISPNKIEIQEDDKLEKFLFKKNENNMFIFGTRIFCIKNDEDEDFLSSFNYNTISEDFVTINSRIQSLQNGLPTVCFKFRDKSFPFTIYDLEKYKKSGDEEQNIINNCIIEKSVKKSIIKILENEITRRILEHNLKN